MPYTFDILFLDNKDAPIPTGPIAHIYVATCTKGGYKGINPDLPLITPQCVSFREFEEQIDRLIGELAELKVQAKLRF